MVPWYYLRKYWSDLMFYSPTLPENQPTYGCPYGYVAWCLAREIVKTIKTAYQIDIITLKISRHSGSAARSNRSSAVVRTFES